MSNVIRFKDGTRYAIAHDFGNGRVVVNMEGIYAFVKREPGTDYWTEDGEPVRSNEKTIFNALVATVENTTTVTDPDGNTSVYRDDQDIVEGSE